MKFRQISIVIGFVILLGAGFSTFKMMSTGEASEQQQKRQKARAVQARAIQNGTNPATISFTGKLEARKRIEIYAEVQGRFVSADHPFKEGVSFNKNEVLVQIDKREAEYNLRSQKSNLKNNITKMLPDLKIDYPEHFDRWQTYLEHIDLNKPVAPLPEVDEGQVDYFISARNIYSLYNTIKAQEERLTDFTIRAPYNGILTAAMIERGTLVRPGQKLGEFVKPGSYEMQVPIGASEYSLINKGDSVHFHSSDIKGEWKGSVIRINNKINPNTQSVQVTLATKGERLKEGMYLEGEIFAGQIPNSAKVPRRFVENMDYVWVIRKGELHKANVELQHTSDGEAIVKGLEDGTMLLNESIPTAYKGMPVKAVEESAI